MKKHPQQEMEWARPDPELICAKWREFIKDPSISLNQLKRTAFQGKLTILRSVYWRIFLGQLPAPPPSSTQSNPHNALNSWSFGLEKSRSEWEDLRKRFLRAPDGLWLEDSIESSSDQNLSSLKLNQETISTSLLPLNSQLTDLGVNNPLSQHENNPWNLWLRDLELRRIVKQDVIRTFPELDYFRQTRTQAMLTNILHVYCKLHQDLGYRQGMHEILGVLLETLDLDTLDPPKSAEDSKKSMGLMEQVLSREHLEHDAFSLFSLLMRSMKTWYDPNLSMPLGDLANSQTTPLTSVGFVPSQLTGIYPVGGTPTTSTCSPNDSSLVHPIVDKCASIFHVYLKHADPELWTRLEKLDIEPQLWGIRWLRLLFTREFNYQESLLLWDGIFAQDGTSLRLADFVCIAMLLRIREGLLDSDYTGALQLILRFPRPTDGDSRIDLLLYQAILLYQFPTPDTVLLIIRQNYDLQLFTPTAQLSTSPQESDSWFSLRRKPPPPSIGSSTLTNFRDSLSRKPHTPPLQSTSSNNTIDESKANNRLSGSDQQGSIGSKKSQSLSKSKSFLGALVDLRRSYSPTVPLNDHLVSESTASLPSSTATPQLHSPLVLANPYSPAMSMTSNRNSISSFTKPQNTQYLANQEVGQALSLCVDALEQNLFIKPASENQSPVVVDCSQGLALGALKHIRDVMLSGFSSGFDSNVMSPLIEYQSATTTMNHHNSPVPDHQQPGSILPNQSVSDSPSPSLIESLNNTSISFNISSTPLPYCPSRSSTTADLPDLTFNQSISDGSPDSSIPLAHISSSVAFTESPPPWTQKKEAVRQSNEREEVKSNECKPIEESPREELLRRPELVIEVGYKSTNEQMDNKKKPDIQPLSPSIFGTKLWIQQAHHHHNRNLSSSSALSNTTNFIRNKNNRADSLNVDLQLHRSSSSSSSSTTTTTSNIPFHLPPEEDHFENLLLVETPHISSK
ncbi:hypothetical protein Pst134EA_002565 [Puccinia striiformis f. sp. tritici]|uniref:hypothetical protein n=1 Tax=Puccinia striiformis f. sp. tritici TaxID=168172 RepID=UPI002007A680|nr:hypothetical protein Pst134EA_002565 [Puccinia striiformis f. sp. tritici]KAH9471935.1 hypothetical protein Pst134EA_002565 [Puccinia striiformis f. sp. tritici]